MNQIFLLPVLVLFLICSCGGDSKNGEQSPDTSDAGENGDNGDDDNEKADDDDDNDEGPFYDPWTVMPTDEIPPIRGFAVKRAIIHSHSPYSHDACDDEPFIDGVRNEQCFEDCRAGMCKTFQDIVFMTDHSSLFAEYEYPEVLLYKEGDTLIERNGLPVANRINCENGHSIILAAGTESEMMPIGLERHVAESIAERKAIYGEASADAIRLLKDAGAKVFLQHTEGWDVETILELPIDGIEMYNLHQNLMDNMGAALEMMIRMKKEPEKIPAIELSIISIFQESEADLFRWSKALMVKPLPAALATDSHRNVFDTPSPDGERLDSFRRMMHWFSNYILVPTEGDLNDAVFKEAIGKGRMYGAFDFLGYPVGFDFHAEANGEIYEMGDNIAAEEATLKVTLPYVYRLNPTAGKPDIRGRILRAADGEWEEVGSGEDDFSVAVGKGAYRAEIRITPEHLREWLGARPDDYIKDTIWVYSNPIYVGMEY
ncbi:MAG: hypothetical protein Kow0090_22200 [Myxococcota bacterium]